MNNFNQVYIVTCPTGEIFQVSVVGRTHQDAMDKIPQMIWDFCQKPVWSVAHYPLSASPDEFSVGVKLLRRNLKGGSLQNKSQKQVVYRNDQAL